MVEGHGGRSGHADFFEDRGNVFGQRFFLTPHERDGICMAEGVGNSSAQARKRATLRVDEAQGLGRCTSQSLS